jgi:hypothetical protein
MSLIMVRVSQVDFAEILAAMREWLDRNNCLLEEFETEAGDDGSIVIKAQFADDHAAEPFRREFRGSYGD